MLDTETKRRIDTARDILVGKVPDPKSQVEQITIALIYKFMDDMDAEAEELGGHRKFFANGYARYGWAKLMRSGLGGHETLNLYAEAIQKMPENPGIPPLFRDIFKNAYLPYRDPETLRAFLKIIDEFEYDHSERLGDAFEYLLSVLGSQGDAGFLISSYKHILKANTDKDGHSTLTPDERGRLADNFKGYDISPDMVRLSLVNMYLHGFTDPHIYEYDTLTSQDRWNEYADVILANPPFMSPKGGIKPHNRFSVQSKRSEVLFVDYMAEHLTPSGRAGIIVPEGIIFQSQTAYTQLRKMLVEDYLVAVVSLPAGVFNPYSGVKTSILILDKVLARQSNTLAFFKIEHDGFNLGAQRRPTDKNDLPQARAEIAEYLRRLRARESLEDFKPTLGLVVPKEKIAANGDYNLSGERYREDIPSRSTFPRVPLDEVFTRISNGVNVTQVDQTAKYRVTRIQTIANGSVNLKKTKFTNDEVKPEAFLQPGDILLSHINSFDHLGKTAIFLEPATDVIHGINLIRLVPDKSRIDPRFAIFVFKSDRFIGTVKSFAQKAVNQASVKTSDLRGIQIPLPPLEVQKQIVAEIEGYQKVIDGARAVIDNYRPHIPIHPDWPMGTLSDVCTLISGQHIDRDDYNTDQVGVDYITGPSDFGLKHPVATRWTSNPKVFAQRGDILITVKGSGLGSINILDTESAAISRQLMAIRVRDADPEFVYVSLLAQFDYIQSLGGGAAIPGITRDHVLGLSIPLPPLETQRAIVAEIEAEQALVAANRELIARMENKIQATLARVWGDDGPTPAEA